MRNLYMGCIAVALFFSGLFYFNVPDNLVGIYGPSESFDVLGEQHALALAEAEALQQRLLQDAQLDPTDEQEPAAAGALLYGCDNYNIVLGANGHFAKELTDTGVIYTVFAGGNTTYGVVDVADSIINFLPRDELPIAVRHRLDSFLPTLEMCRLAPNAIAAPSPYLLSAALQDILQRKL
uniref:hypothetical protein n=1 Tax=Marinobacterium profundum TaxID=1714300 RepID=UPI000A51B90B|nr:hypothetical protein [Marinobacterium profundum]